MNFNEINLKTKEGRMLFQAISVLTSSREIMLQGRRVDGRHTTPDGITQWLEEAAKEMEGEPFTPEQPEKVGEGMEAYMNREEPIFKQDPNNPHLAVFSNPKCGDYEGLGIKGETEFTPAIEKQDNENQNLGYQERKKKIEETLWPNQVKAAKDSPEQERIVMPKSEHEVNLFIEKKNEPGKVYSCSDPSTWENEPTPPEKVIMDQDTPPYLKMALATVFEALREDAEMYYGWQSNIACAFIDAYNKSFPGMKDKEPTPTIANEAAVNFLNQLIDKK